MELLVILGFLCLLTFTFRLGVEVGVLRERYVRLVIARSDGSVPAVEDGQADEARGTG